ncbi:hypothetical protein CRE_30951 [Caenorhabditis remanei]|uniref:Serpentine receptor class gamma n=1 Tax=Caenorhabditis remanei TaxID=31234 RepID=E3LTQ8_CAERE|nr:hypothetical protein CRE_30951 [Caenorhabditis remanei]
MNLSSLPGSIHDKLEYMNFKFQFNIVSLILLISYLTVLFTIFIVCKMLKHFQKPVSCHVQKSVFYSFIWMQLSNLLFYIFDNLVFRIPPSGILTSWLSSTSPAFFLKFSYYFLLITNYFSTGFSLLFCLIRFVVVYFPESYRDKIRSLLKLYIPMSSILPFLLTLFLLPATVYCKQLSTPYSFGEIYLAYIGAWDDIYYDPFNVLVNFSCTLTIFMINILLLCRIRQMMKKRVNHSSRIIKAEVSLTLMTITMNIPYVANAGITVLLMKSRRPFLKLLVFQIISFLDFSISRYTLLPRQIVSDLGLCAVPWIFYLTHPMFRKKAAAVTVSHMSSRSKSKKKNWRI